MTDCRWSTTSHASHRTPATTPGVPGWLDDPAHPAGLYWAYVNLVRGPEQRNYSCGMHTFGLRDAITDMVHDPEPLAGLVHNFLGLTFATRRPINDGDEFSDEESRIAYRVRGEPCATYPPKHMQHNPYGLWRIELVE